MGGDDICLVGPRDPGIKDSRKAFQWLSVASQYTLFLDVVTVGSAMDVKQMKAKRRKIIGVFGRRFFSSLWKCKLALTYLWLSLLTFWRGNFCIRTWKSFLNIFLNAHSKHSAYMDVFLRLPLGNVWLF